MKFTLNTDGPSIDENVLRKEAQFVDGKLHHSIHCCQLLEI